MSEHGRAADRALFAAAMLSALLLRAGPALVHPTRLLGHPDGELPNHFRMLWRAGRALGGAEGPWENLPKGLPIPLMDPVNLPMFGLGAWIHPAVGYNLVVLGALGLAFVGAYALARALGAGGPGAWVAGLAGALSPALAGAVSFGITEALPAGWLALHLAALWRAERAGSWGATVAAGLALGCFALSGWYNALFGLVTELIVVAGLLARSRGRGAGRLLAQGLIAFAMVLPFFLHFWSVRSFWAGRWALPAAPPEGAAMGWWHTPMWGADLASFVRPALEPVPVSKSVYAGLVLLGLAALGARRAPLVAAVALALSTLAAGFWLRVAGWDSGLTLPARWLTGLLPPLVGLSHWHRAFVPASLLLAGLAGLGWERVGARLRGPVLLAMVLDLLIFSGVEFPSQSVDPSPPRAYAALQGEGGIVQLPFDNGRAEFAEGAARVYDLWQPIHGHPIAENYEGPDALLALSPLVKQLDALCADPAAARLPEAAIPGAKAQLVRWKIGWIILHRERAGTPEAASAALRAYYGQPIADIDGVEVYDARR